MEYERARLLLIFQVSKPKIVAGVALVSPSFLTSPCLVPSLDQLPDLALWEAEVAADPVVVESALMRRLATVPERRSACGLRHRLVVILTLTACATLVVGGDSVGAISHEHGVILGQCQVGDKRGEGPAARTLLAHLNVAGMALTLDALHTTKATACLITEQLDAHYILMVKGNQPLARAAAHVLLSGPDTEWSDTTAVDDDHGHGRTERRTIRTTETDDALFPGARQAFRLRRDVGDLDSGWTSKEIVYGITSLPAELAGPAQLNHYQRAHWGVENRLHWIRDVTFREDLSQARTGTTPRALAGFRNLAISTARLADRANITHARRDLLDHSDAFAVYNISSIRSNGT